MLYITTNASKTELFRRDLLAFHSPHPVSVMTFCSMQDKRPTCLLCIWQAVRDKQNQQNSGSSMIDFNVDMVVDIYSLALYVRLRSNNIPMKWRQAFKEQGKIRLISTVSANPMAKMKSFTLHDTSLHKNESPPLIFRN